MSAFSFIHRLRGTWGAALALCVLLAAAALLPARALAHAIIVDASPRHGPVRADTPSTATLQFNSGIEVGLSRIILVTREGAQSTLAIHAGGKHGELRVDLPALPAGQYALKCRVFATDGHFTEEVVQVRVEE